MIEHTKAFGIYHWDTFDNETFLVDQADTLSKASQKMREKYGDRYDELHGADRVEIVDAKGNIVESHNIR